MTFEQWDKEMLTINRKIADLRTELILLETTRDRMIKARETLEKAETQLGESEILS